jgi:hypothetical protein
MHHCSEEDLILYNYGEHADARAIADHVCACGSCREELSRLQRVLAAIDVETFPVPDRGETYGREVWQRVRPQLPPRRFAWLQRMLPQWTAWPQWATAGAFAALLIAAFIAGRYSPRTPPAGQLAERAPATASPSEQVRERVLLVAVGDHLDRSQMVLAELVNAGPHPDARRTAAVDISTEQEWAEDLVASNRLYRQTAEQTGDTTLETVLDELEPILLEIAHSPSSISADQLDALRQRIEAQGLLFKIHIVGSNVRDRERTTAPARPIS